MRRPLHILLGLLIIMSNTEAAAAQPSASPGAMIKFASIWEQPGDNAALDHWYRTTHARESLLFVGPWLRRYWAYRAYQVPAEADVVGAVRYRLTEMWYGSAADLQEANRAWYPLTPPPRTLADPGRSRITQIYVHAVPEERWRDGWPRDRPDYFRWVFFMRYPPGVSTEAGESWFRTSFAPRLAAAPAVRRFVCAKSVQPTAGSDGWLRMCEVWFDDYAGWKATVLSDPGVAPPPWGGAFPHVPIVSIFTHQSPDMDFLRDGYRAP